MGGFTEGISSWKTKSFYILQILIVFINQSTLGRLFSISKIIIDTHIRIDELPIYIDYLNKFKQYTSNTGTQYQKVQFSSGSISIKKLKFHKGQDLLDWSLIQYYRQLIKLQLEIFTQTITQTSLKLIHTIETSTEIIKIKKLKVVSFSNVSSIIIKSKTIILIYKILLSIQNLSINLEPFKIKIKVVDLLTLYKKEGKRNLFRGAGIEKTIVIIKLICNLAIEHSNLSIFSGARK